ncbi:MAG TPA: GNAT family N-acetyltransferase [Chryseolinea sp.]|nr:GNAT family N-acetyltransferase [Chryseolinea sp.]
MTTELQIREAVSADAEHIWSIIQEVISSGDTYAFAPDTPKADMLNYWFASGAYPFVALVNGKVAGTYVIRSNQPGLGSHIANGAFMTASQFRKNGVGRAMGLHALKAARQRGYLAMQFNFVVKSNTRAVALWESLGFRIMAEIPDAYRHASDGFTNIYIMHRGLEDQ